MGIFIKGMKMPKNCEECDFAIVEDVDFDYSLYCKCSKKYCDLDALWHPIGWNCPLVEVPPHGDLVDRDVLMTEVMDSDLDHLQRDDWKEVIQIVADAPTIIEAEGSDT